MGNMVSYLLLLKKGKQHFSLYNHTSVNMSLCCEGAHNAVVSPPARKGSMTFLGWVSVEHFFKRIPLPFAKKKTMGTVFSQPVEFSVF
jgi:hypothetical protein